MRILVTGGAGFIGSQLIKDLCVNNHEVSVIDNLDSTLYSSELKKLRINNLSREFGFEFFSMDINDDLEFLLRRNFEYVVNLAALPGQALSWSHLPVYTKSNFLGVGNILKSLVAIEKMPFLQISTSSVYGKIASGDEDESLQPFSPYGVTKRAAEDLIKSYKSNFDLNYTIFRLFSVFGPGQRPDMAVHRFLKLIDAGEEIQIFGDGQQSRSMTDVTQVSQAIQKLIGLNNSTEKSSVYNIAGGNSISVLDLVSICERVAGKSAKLSFVARPAGDQLETRGNTSRAERELGFNPDLDIAEVVARQFDSIKTHGL
jgi:nucleoside-diphosphate-sugar epimerase